MVSGSTASPPESAVMSSKMRVAIASARPLATPRHRHSPNRTNTTSTADKIARAITRLRHTRASRPAKPGVSRHPKGRSAAGAVPLRAQELVHAQVDAERRVRGVAVTTHADALHHPTGRDVLGLVDADDLVHAEDVESEPERGPTAFRRQAAAPVVGIETPSHLHRGHDLRQERGRLEAEKPDDAPGLTVLDRPVRPPAVSPQIDPSIQKGAGLARVPAPPVRVPPDLGLREDRLEILEVVGSPATQQQPIRLALVPVGPHRTS